MKAPIAALMLLSAITAGAQRFSALTSTNLVRDTNLVAVEVFPNATNGTKSISISNLAVSLGPYITNSAGGGSATNAVSTVRTNGTAISTASTSLDFIEGTNVVFRATNAAGVVTVQINSTSTSGGAGITTNANQFGAVVPVTIKSGALLTNIQSYGTLSAAGPIEHAGGANHPTLTASRVAILNGNADLTNSPGVSTTELEYLDGVTSAIQAQIDARQGGSAALSNAVAVGIVTNITLMKTLWVSTNGNDATAVRGSIVFPYGSLSNALSSAVNGDTIKILAGSHLVYAYQTNNSGGNGHVKHAYTRKTGIQELAIIGEDNAVLVQVGRGCAVAINMATNVWIENIVLKSSWTNGALTLGPSDNALPMAFAHWGTNRNITYRNCHFYDVEGSAIHATSGNTTELMRVDGLDVFYSTFTRCGYTNWVGASMEGGGGQSHNNTRIIGCTFRECSRDWEQFTDMDETIDGFLWENNTSIDAYAFGVFQVDSRAHANVRIVNSYWKSDPAKRAAGSWDKIYLTTGWNWLIANNTFDNAWSDGAHINLDSQSTGMTNVLIQGNIARGVNAHFISTLNGSRPKDMLVIRGNSATTIGASALNLGASGAIVENNVFSNWGTNGATPGINLRGQYNGSVFLPASNIVLRANTLHDATDTAISITFTNFNTQLIDNLILAGAGISDSGTATIIKSLGTNGWHGIGVAAPLGALDVAGTNRANQFHFRGGQATNSLLFVDGTTNANPATIGPGITFSAGVVAAAGVLTNLVNTVGQNVTNVVSLSTTNATSKPLTNSYTSGVMTLFGLEAGANITLTPNASNIVIATGGAVGEANVNGETSVTNSTRIGLVHGKTDVTNTLRSLQGGLLITLTNQGTNIVIAGTSNFVVTAHGNATVSNALFVGSAQQMKLFSDGAGATHLQNTVSGVSALQVNESTDAIVLGAIASTPSVTVPVKLVVTGGNSHVNTTNIVASLMVTNFVKYIPQTISGAGNGNTNYTLLAGREMYLGSSNVNISAVMDYDADAVVYWTAVVTNLSAINWGIGFSSVTNRWKFLGNYGTNAPTVLTNNTMMQLHGRQHGTNVTLSYSYWNPAL